MPKANPIISLECTNRGYARAFAMRFRNGSLRHPNGKESNNLPTKPLPPR